MVANAAYFIRRADEERAAAMKAVHPRARAAHQQMADRYDQLAGGAPPLPIKIADKD